MARNAQAKFIISAEDRSTRTLRRIKEEFGGLERSAQRSLGGLERSAGAARLALGGLAGVASIEGLRRGLTASGNEFALYERSLVNVVKTTNLAGEELRAFEANIASLESIIPVSAQELNKLAGAAGQLGVQGTRNLTKFAETFARLERASDIIGEAGAQDAARLFNITGTDINNIDRFGASITALGNDAAATENQILHMATFVGQSIGTFGVSITDILGLSTAMKELGLRAELSGGAVGRAFAALRDLPQLGGEKARELARLMDKPLEEIAAAFRDDSIGTFVEFLERLSNEGERAGITLNQLGLGGSENLRVFPTLANNVELLTKRLRQASDEWEANTALIEESSRAFDTHEGRVQQAANAWAKLKRAAGEYLVTSQLVTDALETFADGFDGLIRSREAKQNPFGNFSTAEAEQELDRLLKQFERLDRVIAGVEPLPGGVDDPFAVQDQLTEEIDGLKKRLGLLNEEQVTLARANAELNNLIEERTRIFARLDDEANAQGFTFDIIRAKQVRDEIEGQIAAQEKLIRSLKGITEEQHNAELASKAEAEERQKVTEAAVKQAEAEAALTELFGQFTEASQSKTEAARAELAAIEAKFQPLVEEGRITQEQYDLFVRTQSVKLGLLEDEAQARERVTEATRQQAEAEARQAEGFVRSLLSQEERLQQRIAEIGALPTDAFSGLEFGQAEALQRAQADLDEYRSKAETTYTAAETAAIEAFDEMASRAESLRREFETPFEELSRRLAEIRELTSAGYLSDEESARYVSQLVERFETGAEQVENRWSTLASGLRGTFRRLLGDTNVDFKDFALQLAADLAAAEFDRLVFGQGGVLEGLTGGVERDQQPVSTGALDRVLLPVEPTLSDPGLTRFESQLPTLPVEVEPQFVANTPALDYLQPEDYTLPVTPELHSDPFLDALDQALAQHAAAVDLGIEPPSDAEVQQLLDAAVQGAQATVPVDVQLQGDQDVQSAIDALRDQQVPVNVIPFPVDQGPPRPDQFGLQDGVEVPINPGPIDPTLFGDAVQRAAQAAQPQAQAAGEQLARDLFAPLETGPDLAAIHSFTIVEDEALRTADTVAAAWQRSNDNTVRGFQLFKGASLEIFGDLAGQAANLLGGIFANQTGGANLGGLFSTVLGSLFGSKSFSGGGFTGFGGRNGGLDGQGGFPALLHPNEQVIDLTRGGGGELGGGNFTQVLHIQPGVSQEMVPQIQEAAKQGALAAIRDMHRRGGRRARVHGVA